MTLCIYKNLFLYCFRKFLGTIKQIDECKVSKYAFSFTSLFTRICKINVVEIFYKKSLFLLYLCHEFFELCVYSVISFIKLDFAGIKIFRESEKSRENSRFTCIGAHMLTVENHCVCAFFTSVKYSLLFTTIHAACLSSMSMHATFTAKNIFPLLIFTLPC